MESNWVHSASRRPIGLLYLHLVIMRMQNLVEWWLAAETEVLGEKPAPVPLCPPEIPYDLTGRELGPPRWEASN
jgi:hypothetical protein